VNLKVTLYRMGKAMSMNGVYLAVS
jgi:hypothetical protein